MYAYIRIPYFMVVTICSIEMFDCAQCALLLPLTQVAFGRKRLRVEVKQEASQRTVWQQDTAQRQSVLEIQLMLKLTGMLS